MSSNSESVIRNGPGSPKSIFNECCAVQAASRDLVVFSSTASQIVTLAWPTFRSTKIKPTGIKDWLRARTLHWSCFCQLVAPAGVHRSSQIVEAMSGDVMVFCHYEPTTCGFFMNLTNIYATATLTSEYPLLMPVRSVVVRQQGTMRRDATQLINFQLDNLQASEVAPYFRDYCGDMVSGVLQMSGSRQNVSQMSATTKVRRQPRSSLPNVFSKASTSPQVASTSSNASPSNSTSLRDSLAEQQDILERLAEGEGIDKAEWDGVVETCDVCWKVFVGEVFKAHYQGCWNSSV